MTYQSSFQYCDACIKYRAPDNLTDLAVIAVAPGVQARLGCIGSVPFITPSWCTVTPDGVPMLALCTGMELDEDWKI